MLTFLIHRLEELQEGYEEMIPYYRNWRKQHKDDIIRTEYERATTAVTETCRKSIGTKDLIRRLSAIVKEAVHALGT
jgi:hypothetical protein